MSALHGRFAQRIVEAVPGLIYVVDIRQKKIVFLNRGIDAGGLLLDADDWQPLLDYLSAQSNLRDLETADFQFRTRDKNGGRRWIETRNGVFSRSADGTVSEIIGAASDATARKATEDAINFMADLNQAILPLADPDQIMTLAVRMLGEYLNVDRCGYAEVEKDEDHFVVIGSYTRGDMPNILGRFRMSEFGDRERKILLESHPYVVNDIVAESPPGTDLSLYEMGAIRALICVPLNKDGNFVARMAVHQRTPRKWSQAEIGLVTKVAERCWEAVERARVLRQLKASDDRYRAFVANSTEGIWRYELEQPIPIDLPTEEQVEMLFKHAYLAECNDAMARMYGYDNAAQIMGARLSDMLVVSDERNISYLRQFKESGYRLADFETHEVDKHGNPKCFSNNLIAVVENGALVRGWGTQRDITEQKHAEEALRTSEEQFSKAFMASPNSLVISRLSDGVILEVNDSFLALTGYERSEVLGKSTLELGVYADVSDRQRAMAVLKEQHHVRDFELRARRKTGEVRLMSFSAEPMDIHGEPCWLTIGRDITEQKRADEGRLKSEEEARRHLAYVEAIYATAPVGLCFVDTDLRYRSINTRLAQMNGKSVEEHLGRTLREIMADTADTIEPYYRRVIATGEPILNVETSVKREPGTPQYFDVSYYPLKDSTGRVFGVNAVVVEITQRKHAEEERERLLTQEKAAREEAETANRMKDEFLATISHELRTPLTSILGWARILIDNTLPPSQRRHALSVIERSAKSQTELIDNILDTSRIITGRLKLDARPVEIDQVFEAAVDVIRPSAEAKRIDLQATIESRGSLVYGDANRLQQVIWNLLANAVKFTNPEGRIEARLTHGDDYVEVSVRDTGIGIEPQFLPYVFDRFRQADSSSTRKYGGLGLGLAIVRHMTEMHGGAVSAWSAGKGKGATFKVTLPLTSASRQPETRPTEPPPSETVTPARSETCETLAGLRVLVVEDDPDTLDMLRYILDRCGAAVITAASTNEALELFDRSHPNALVTDLAMPGQDGYELIARIRERGPEHGGDIPAVALTAHTRVEDRDRALAAGFQKHVAKPVDPDELISVVSSLIH